MKWVQAMRTLMVCVTISSMVIVWVINHKYVRDQGGPTETVRFAGGNTEAGSYAPVTPLSLTFDLVQSLVQNDSVILRGSGRSGEETMTSEVELKMPVGGKQWKALKLAMIKAERRLTTTLSFPWKPVKMEQVDCSRLFVGDPEELKKASRLQEKWPFTPLPATNISILAENCTQFKQSFGFITSSLSQEEKEFPIAFSILVFKDVEQVVDLLRAIYRPQNHYCIHVDLKAASELRQAFKSVAGCFDNVFLSSRSFDVRWGEFSVLEPEIICMEDLWKFKSWKYFINLTGQEFPLRTNWELVQILRAYNGATSLEGTRARANKDRFPKAPPPPAGIQATKGSVHVTVNRDFVDFVLHTRVAREFLNWSRAISVPDEVFFSSLNHNPHLGIKGTYLGEPETDPEKYPFMTRFKNWGGFPFDYPCAGKRVRAVCVLTVGDLPLLVHRPELFANKFHADYSQIAVGCLAERLYNSTREEFLGLKDFDVSYYASLPFVANMVKESTFNRTVQAPF